MSLTRLSPAGLCLLCITGVAGAHHSRAFYDMTQEVVIDGTVRELDWKNPHISIIVRTTGEDGTPRLQEVEAMAVSEANAAGLGRDALAEGSHVVIRAHPGRKGSGSRAIGVDVRTSDGRLLPLNPESGFAVEASATAEAQGLEGPWAPSVETFRATAQAMANWPYTDTARAHMQRAQQTASAILGICKDFPPPGLSIFPDLREISIGDSSVEMRYEAQGQDEVRVVHLDQTAHPADLAPTLLGHSIGHFEQGTLVIDTVGFAPFSAGITVGVASSPRKHLVERLTLMPDKRHLRYEVTLEDPESLTAPGKLDVQWDYRPDLAPSGVACDPDAARKILE